jgi:hypothetical protein
MYVYLIMIMHMIYMYTIAAQAGRNPYAWPLANCKVWTWTKVPNRPTTCSVMDQRYDKSLTTTTSTSTCMHTYSVLRIYEVTAVISFNVVL